MRRRHQRGTIKKFRGSWVGQFWEDGHRRSRTLGKASRLTKSQARCELDAILEPINRQDLPSDRWTFGNFVRQVYLPFYQWKWKNSTARTNQDRIRHHLLSEFDARTLGSIRCDELQELLIQRANAGLSFSTVDHLRWDLRQIFAMAVSDRYIDRNPAEQLFTPRKAPLASRTTMTWKEVTLLFSVLDLRELLICKLAIITGMRPGEIFALQWKHVEEDHLDIQQRIYRGEIDSPKTTQSVRIVALSEGLESMMSKWKAVSIDTGLEAWVFPSEVRTPLSKDNCWRRYIGPRLESVGLKGGSTTIFL